LVIGADTGVAKLGVGVVYGECLGVWTIMRWRRMKAIQPDYRWWGRVAFIWSKVGKEECKATRQNWLN
jgi:hypothetical protein